MLILVLATGLSAAATSMMLRLTEPSLVVTDGDDGRDEA
jgi:hypothetical protein